MSEKYLIDKASLTALADITRAYNETPDKEYSLAEITEQAKSASENFYNLFNEGLAELKSETATSLKSWAFCGFALGTGTGSSIYLPNVTEIGGYALQNNRINYFYAPLLQQTFVNTLSRCTMYKSWHFPSLKTIGSGSFTYITRPTGSNAVFYLPALESIGSGAFENSQNALVILKTIPALASAPTWTSTRKVNILIPPNTLENYRTATNWADVPLTEATTYEGDYS